MVEKVTKMSLFFSTQISPTKPTLFDFYNFRQAAMNLSVDAFNEEKFQTMLTLFEKKKKIVVIFVKLA